MTNAGRPRKEKNERPHPKRALCRERRERNARMERASSPLTELPQSADAFISSDVKGRVTPSENSSEHKPSLIVTLRLGKKLLLNNAPSSTLAEVRSFANASASSDTDGRFPVRSLSQRKSSFIVTLRLGKKLSPKNKHNGTAKKENKSAKSVLKMAESHGSGLAKVAPTPLKSKSMPVNSTKAGEPKSPGRKRTRVAKTAERRAEGNNATADDEKAESTAKPQKRATAASYLKSPRFKEEKEEVKLHANDEKYAWAQVKALSFRCAGAHKKWPKPSDEERKPCRKWYRKPFMA